MKLHLIALPHTQVTPTYSHCAYSMKIAKFCRMMAPRGWEILLYAPEGSDPNGAELVACLSEEERLELCGPHDPNALPAWPSDELFTMLNVRAAVELRARAEPGDLLLLSSGWSQRRLADNPPVGVTVCEYGVGYEGIYAPFAAFESYAWMHSVYRKNAIDDGRWFDAVIPNYFDPAEFHVTRAARRRVERRFGSDYLLFIGRLIGRKGPKIASEIAKAAGLPLVVAGAGATEGANGRIFAPEVTLEGDHLLYAGPVGVEERAALMAGARALLAPTTYIEPFGGVAVEAMMAGTPAVATDWGAFPETVEEGVTGYRFRTLGEGVRAVERAAELDRDRVRARAVERFSLEAVAPQYEAWFRRLATLPQPGWYEMDAPLHAAA